MLPAACTLYNIQVCSLAINFNENNQWLVVATGVGLDLNFKSRMKGKWWSSMIHAVAIWTLLPLTAYENGYSNLNPFVIS